MDHTIRGPERHWCLLRQAFRVLVHFTNGGRYSRGHEKASSHYNDHPHSPDAGECPHNMFSMHTLASCLEPCRTGTMYTDFNSFQSFQSL